MFEIRLEEWINGTATPFKTIDVKDKEDGLRTLHYVGKGKFYNNQVAGYLVDPDGCTIAILNILEDSYTVKELG